MVHGRDAKLWPGPARARACTRRCRRHQPRERAEQQFATHTFVASRRCLVVETSAHRRRFSRSRCAASPGPRRVGPLEQADALLDASASRRVQFLPDVQQPRARYPASPNLRISRFRPVLAQTQPRCHAGRESVACDRTCYTPVGNRRPVGRPGKLGEKPTRPHVCGACAVAQPTKRSPRPFRELPVTVRRRWQDRDARADDPRVRTPVDPTHHHAAGPAPLPGPSTTAGASHTGWRFDAPVRFSPVITLVLLLAPSARRARAIRFPAGRVIDPSAHASPPSSACRSRQAVGSSEPRGRFLLLQRRAARAVRAGRGVEAFARNRSASPWAAESLTADIRLSLAR